MVLQVVQKLSQAALDTELDPSESELVLGHTRSSCSFGTLLGSSVGLGIPTGLGALPAEEERVDFETK